MANRTMPCWSTRPSTWYTQRSVPDADPSLWFSSAVCQQSGAGQACLLTPTISTLSPLVRRTPPTLSPPAPHHRHQDDASDSASLFDGFTRRPVACAMCGHRLGWEHAWMPPSPSPSPEAQGVLEDIQGMRGEVASGADAGLSAVDTSLEDALPALGSLDVGRAMVRGMTSTSPTSGFEASPLPPGSSASRGEGERGAELGLKLLSMLPPGVAGGAEGGLLVVALGRARDGAHEGSSHLEECLTSVAELCKTRAGGGGGAAGEDLDWLLSNLLSEVARLKAFREGKEKERERENSSSEAEANGGVLAGDGGPESLPARTASSPQRRPSVGSGSASPYKDFGAAAVTRGTRNAPFRLADGTWVRPQTSAAASAGNASPGLGGRSGASKSVKSPLSTKSKPPPKRAVSSCS